MSAVSFRCPYCKHHVKTLVGGLRQEYAGRQKVCVSCGAIWRFDQRRWQEFLGVFGAVVVAGAVVPYFFLKPAQADIWCVCWLLFSIAILWPVVYYILWKLKLRR